MASSSALSFKKATLQFGKRVVWKNITLDIQPGEIIAILGPNGTGKTTLLRSVLGLNPLSAGSIEIHGQPARRGNNSIGYIPQQKALDKDLPIRGRDIIRLGLDGHRFGFAHRRDTDTERIEEVIKEVGAVAYADQPIGLLSGGEQQRLRIAQSLLGRPKLLLCDEPLLSLDLKSQRSITNLIDSYRKRFNTTVLFVTHDINPILDIADRVLYLVDGKWAIGTPSEILTTESLTRLYGAPVDVLKVHGRVVVISNDPQTASEHHHIQSKTGAAPQ